MMAAVAVSLRPRLSGDRKVSPVIRRQGSKDAVVINNSYGLPAGRSCPGATEFCGDCYAARTERVFTSSERLVSANFDLHLAAGDNALEHERILRDAVSQFDAQFDKAFAAGRVAADGRIFRIHWDGDFFNAAYSVAWANVMYDFPHVQFWAYTRSFGFVGHLAHVSNLSLYLSVDRFNVGDARDVLDVYPHLRVALCADTHADAQVLADKLERKAVACPENVRKIPLVMHMSGRRTLAVEVGTDGQGACAACRLCVDGVRDVQFATSGR